MCLLKTSQEFALDQMVIEMMKLEVAWLGMRLKLVTLALGKFPSILEALRGELRARGNLCWALHGTLAGETCYPHVEGVGHALSEEGHYPPAVHAGFPPVEWTCHQSVVEVSVGKTLDSFLACSKVMVCHELAVDSLVSNC